MEEHYYYSCFKNELTERLSIRREFLLHPREPKTLLQVIVFLLILLRASGWAGGRRVPAPPEIVSNASVYVYTDPFAESVYRFYHAQRSLKITS